MHGLLLIPVMKRGPGSHEPESPYSCERDEPKGAIIYTPYRGPLSLSHTDSFLLPTLENPRIPYTGQACHAANP